MNIQQDVPHDHNADKRFKSFDNKLDAISEDVKSAYVSLASHNTAIYNAISKTLDLGYEFSKKRRKEQDDNWDFLKEYLIYHGERWSLKCETTIFHGLVSIAFNQIDDHTGKEINTAPSLSKYRAILRYAFKRQLSSQELINDLEEHGLTEIYEDAISVLRFDPIDNYIEHDTERFVRATTYLDNLPSLPSGSFTTDIPQPETSSEFVSAIIKITKTGFNVVGLVENETQDQIRSKIIDLVPAEAKHARQKLKDKNLYHLYVVCDLFKRFAPKVADIQTWNKASRLAKLPQLPVNATQNDTDDYVRALKEHSHQHEINLKNIASQVGHSPHRLPSNKFSLLNALDFKFDGSKLTVTSKTTHPNTPCWEMIIPLEKPHLQQLHPLMIKDLDAMRFNTQFLEYNHWSLSRKGIGFAASAPNPEASPLLIQDFTAIAKWRSIDKNIKVVERFKLDKFQLDNLSNWKTEFSATPQFMRKSFHTILDIKIEEEKLMLVFPNDRNQKRSLGTAVNNHTNLILNKDRLFDFASIKKLIQLAQDYGLEYELELLDGHQGPSALRFHCIGLPFETSITIPLLLSVKGNPVEITR